MSMNLLVGQRIKILRKSKGKTQLELAQYLNVSKSSICNYEKGRNIPIETLVEIANYFDVTVDYLIGINRRQISSRKKIKLFDDEIELVLALRNTTIYNNMIANPKQYAKLIEKKTKDYKIKI